MVTWAAKGPLQGTYRMEGISYDMVADIARGMLSVAAGPGDDLPWEASGEGGGFPPGKKRKKR